jgi:hypothetical protein
MPTYRNVSETIRTTATNSVDIIFVIDTSTSMDSERAALGQRLSSFVSGLNGLDWQICLTTTDMKAEQGTMVNFSNNQKVLRPTTPNADSVFLNTLVNIPAGSGDERGIAALNYAVQRNDTDCIRSGAALSAVILTDEDERSTGGYSEFVNDKQYHALEAVDYPENLLKLIASQYGRTKMFTAHSIVIRSNDNACFDFESQESDVYFGTRYEALSRQSGGVVGNICASDYAQQLGEFGDRVNESLASVTLQCVPPEKPTVSGTSSAITWSGDKIFFDPSLPAGSSITLKYRCAN